MNKIGNYTAVSEVSTLLVLRHSSNSVGIVQGIENNGNLIDCQPDRSKVDTVLRIDSAEDSFTDFYSDFYHQLKDPSNYSFFKVREFEAHDTAIDLQQYINCLSDGEKEDLKAVEVSIEAVNAIRNKKNADSGSSVLKDDLSTWSSVIHNSSQYRYQIEDVPWDTMGELNLDMEKLEEIGALDSLLKGYKTPMLIPIPLSDGYSVSMVDARLELRLDDKGEVVVRIHRLLEKPDFKEKFWGFEFTKEDESNLLTCGNMGRVVDLVDPWTGELIPSLISLDSLTNELIPLRMEFVRIPDMLCGVRLDLEQKQVLRDGKALFVENMVSKKGKFFSATVQFNADRQWVEFMFENKFRSAGFSGIQHFESGIPLHFRGIKIH